MPYLNVNEIESALLQLSTQFPQYCKLIKLPYKTHEGRECTALKIRYTSLSEFFIFSWIGALLTSFFDFIDSMFSPFKKQVIFVGGHHAREWVPPDALVFVCQKVIKCLYDGSAISVGNYEVSRLRLRNILKNVNITIFPQINPDGRNLTMTTDSNWRKNLGPNIDAAKVGVDLNRNYDYLWNFPEKFATTATVVSSTNESDDTFIGPAPLSEPETRNVRWLVNNQKAEFFIDVHSFSEFILYNWADDQSQNTDATMNFQNNTYSNVRGIKDDNAYREYIPQNDGNLNRHLAEKMRDAIKKVRNHEYFVQEWVDMYPASGTSTDYHQSLHFINSRSKKIHSFCIECGSEFQPRLDERAWVIKEVTAALLQFAKEVAEI